MNDGIQTIETEQTDALLIEEILSGKRESFDVLMGRHGKMIFNLCYKMTGDYDEANDCAQESFLTIYRKLKQFQFKSSFSTWIYRVTINTCKNHLASSYSRKKKKNVSINGLRDDNTGTYEIPDHSQLPEEQVLRQEKEEAIMKALEELPEDLKVLVVLRDMDGRSYEEIAEITGEKLGTVKSKLSRGRSYMRDKLRGILNNGL